MTPSFPTTKVCIKPGIVHMERVEAEHRLRGSGPHRFGVRRSQVHRDRLDPLRRLLGQVVEESVQRGGVVAGGTLRCPTRSSRCRDRGQVSSADAKRSRSRRCRPARPAGSGPVLGGDALTHGADGAPGDPGERGHGDLSERVTSHTTRSSKGISSRRQISGLTPRTTTRSWCTLGRGAGGMVSGMRPSSRCGRMARANRRLPRFVPLSK